MDRKAFLSHSMAAVASLALPKLELFDEDLDAQSAKDPRKVIAMVVYPEFTVLDLIGPYQFLSALTDHRVLLVSKTKGLVTSDTGLAVQTDVAFKNCPKEVSVLFVPGGTNGTLKAMKDPETLSFVKNRGARADYVTSVCTGSLLLGAAGLLKGKQATAHWLVRDLLKDFGAVPVNKRVVIDGNRITGAGVSSGLDLGLAIINQIAGAAYAKQCQLWFEYDPQPMFDFGSREKSKPEDVQMLESMVTEFRKELKQYAKARTGK